MAQLTTPRLEIAPLDILNSFDRAILVCDRGLVVHYANRAWYEFGGETERGTLGRSLFALGAGAFEDARLRVLLESVVPHDVTISAYDIRQPFPVGGERVLRLAAQRIKSTPPATGGCLVTLRDVTETVGALDLQTRELDRVTTMIDEIHHRVKNNIAFITSMVRLETNRLDDAAAKDAFRRVAARVDALAQLYELLVLNSADNTVDLREYLDRICRSVRDIATDTARGWTIEVKGDRIEVDVRDAIAIGSIVHELVTNAAKYAFQGRQDIGQIRLECEQRVDRLLVHVADNGSGVEGSIADPKSTGLGMRLVDMYLGQIAGRMVRESDGRGTRYTIVVPTTEHGRAANGPVRLVQPA